MSLPVVSQHIASGKASVRRVQPTSSFTVNFPTTPVNSTSIQDCYYNCFFTGSSNCNYSGTISLTKQIGAPFRVTNLRKATFGSCTGSPVSLPVTLQAGEWLLQDFVFTPTSPGSFQDTYIYSVTPTNSATDTWIWVLSGSTPATVVCPTGLTAGGATGTYTVTLSAAAPAGLTATPDSSNTAVATVPAPFTIPTGATTFTFQVRPVGAGNADIGVTVSGIRNDCSMTVAAAAGPVVAPTLSKVGLLILSILLAVVGVFVVRRF